MSYIKPLVERTPEQVASLRKYAKENGLPEDIYESFITYAQYMIPSFGEEQLEWQWYHYYTAKYYQSIIEGDLSFYTVEIAPQSGKSLILTLFITYCFGINPNLKMIYYTYSEDRAIAVVKEYILTPMSSDKYHKVFPHILLKADLSQKGNDAKSLMQRKTSTLKDTEFTISSPFKGQNYKGKLLARGVSQGVHGYSANLSFIDDYAPTSATASSQNFRNKLERWFFSDVVSRWQPNTKFVIVCTRWYANDIITILREKMELLNDEYAKLSKEPPKYKGIKLRAEYRITDNNPPEDPRTKEGEWLCEAFITKYLMAKGSADYQALYNCDEHAEADRQQIRESDFGYYDQLPDVSGRYIFSIDGAATTNKESDKTAIGYWFVSGFRRYLIRLWYFKKETPQLIEYVKTLLDTNHYDECLIEFASAGIPLSQALKNAGYSNITQLGFSGNPVNSTRKINTEDKIAKGNSKIERYLRVVPEFQYAEKRVFIPRIPVEFQQEMVRQLITFDGTAGRADDLVDMTTYLLFYTTRKILKSYKTNSIHDKIATKSNFMCYNNTQDNYFLGR